MRCEACNKNLNDFEATRKSTDGKYYDLCNKCFKGLGLVALIRDDLDPTAEAPADWDDLADGFLDPLAEDPDSEQPW